MSRKHALVLGAGIAGLTCAWRLRAHGWRVDCVASDGPPGPVVILDRATADLVLELWQGDETLFAGAHRLHGRIVRWEHATTPTCVDAPALAMPVDVLAARLADRARAAALRFVAPERADPARYAWVVQAGGRDAMPAGAIEFGRRRGVAVPIRLTPRARTDRTSIESVPGGWLFVIPQGLGCGTLQAVFRGGTSDPRAELRNQLARSSATSELVEDVIGEPTRFSAMPRLALVPCAQGTIAVGDAAISLDPLSGSGLASGMRSAILAAAVLDAAARDAAPQPYFDHYTRRLRDSMRRHVLSCIELYSQAACASDWRAEIDAMTEALRRLPAEKDTPRFRLDHGRLDRMSPGTEAEATRAERRSWRARGAASVT